MIELTEDVLRRFCLVVLGEIPSDVLKAMPNGSLTKTLQAVLRDALSQAQPPVSPAIQLAAVQSAIDTWKAQRATVSIKKPHPWGKKHP